MNAKIPTILLSLLLASGAFARPGDNIPDDPEASRECFELAQRIRQCGDAAERTTLVEKLREMVVQRHTARLEEGKRRIAEAERAIAERHAAALRGLEAVKQRVAEAETHLDENVEREMEALLAGEKGDAP